MLFRAFWDGEISFQELKGNYPETGCKISRTGKQGDNEKSRSVLKKEGHQAGQELEIGEIGDESEKRILASRGVVEARKDFANFDPEELDRIKTLVIRLAMRLGLRLSRRFRNNERAIKIDFRRSFRSALQYGGDLLELHFRRPKPIPSRIYLLLDISGSMDINNQFFIMFMYGLQQALASARCFVFSTHLTPISHHLKTARFKEAWNRVQNMSVNWSGGTEIGKSLMQFYSNYLGSGSARRAIFIIVSDGWDRGRPQILSEAMDLIHQRCRHIFWLNPLLATPNYQPICSGMKAALPYVDSFLPFISITSLERLCRKIETVW
jgi:uncharacterized protein with von Willebrand factor type A (vWA) domain